MLGPMPAAKEPVPTASSRSPSSRCWQPRKPPALLSPRPPPTTFHSEGARDHAPPTPRPAGPAPSGCRTHPVQFAADRIPQHVMLRTEPEPLITPPLMRIQPHRLAHQLGRLPLEPRPDGGMQED